MIDLEAHAGRPAAGLALAAVLLLVPCGAGAESAPAGDAAVSELPQQELSEPALGALRDALEAYEGLRAELAADRLEGLDAGASRLAEALRAALEEDAALSAPAREVVEEAIRAAGSLAAAEDLAAARLDFGEVSRGLLLLGGSDPRLTEGLYVFTCPMAEGFERWIQTGETMANPYMGPAMLTCGSRVSGPAPEREARTADAGETPEARGPKLEPGIPGLKMVDVRDHKFLWREIEQLQVWERGDRISIAELRSKAIEKTAHFLELHGAAGDELAEVAAGAIADIRDAFHRERAAGIDPSAPGGGLSTELAAAVARVNGLLGEAPRHQLFAPDTKKWLLKLAFGPREAEEEEEKRTARLAE